MRQYIQLINKVLNEGESREDRTKTGVLSTFAERMIFNLNSGFPLVTTRKIDFRLVVDELLWFISGSTNINDLPERTRKWWVKWADDDGNLGPIYGEQLRHQKTITRDGKIFEIDQLQMLIDELKANPFGRRHLINLWHTSAMLETALPCCHGSIIQFYISNRNGERWLDCQMYQRSADLIIGVPVNIASYSLLMHMIAQQIEVKPGILTWVGGDVHIYKNLINAALEIVDRAPFGLPQLNISKAKSINDYGSSSITLSNYQPWPSIKVSISI